MKRTPFPYPSLTPLLPLTPLLFVGGLASCIDTIDLGDVVAEQYRQELYIEGSILSGATSVFHVQRAVPMNANERDLVTTATIRIVSDMGFESDAATLADDGAYIIPTGTLNSTERYKMVAEVEGETYESDYLTLADPVPIDSVYFEGHASEYLGHNLWTKPSVEIKVDAHAPNDASRYYMWTFDEDFEFHAPYDLSENLRDPHGLMPMFDPAQWPGVERYGANPYYYCWVHNTSTSYELYNTEALTENRVTGHIIATFSKGMAWATSDELSPRFSHLYAVTVHQSVLDSAAYSYFRTMEQYTEEMGGLFSPTPQDLHGNIHCTTHPDKRAHGHIIASATSSYRAFLTNSELRALYGVNVSYQPATERRKTPDNGAWVKECRDNIEWGNVVGVLEPDNVLTGEYIYPRICYDCLRERGATKQKPEWWPNDDE